jgi:hypothetical protein
MIQVGSVNDLKRLPIECVEMGDIFDTRGRVAVTIISTIFSPA